MNPNRLQTRLINANLSLAAEHRDRCLRLPPDVSFDLSSSDYLGLARDQQVLRGVKVMDWHQFGSTGSRLLGGNTPIAHSFEVRFAKWLGVPSARFFNSGYHANVGVLSSVVGPGDWVLLDRNCHASIIDGVRLSGASFRRFRHNDMAHLARLLRSAISEKGTVLVVTESLFSMDGDRAPLTELVAICRQFGASLMLDEAHALGVFGPDGRGLAAKAGVLGDIDIWVGAFGKAWGGAGAVVGGSDALIQFITSTARSLIFSTAVPPIVLEWNDRVLGLMPSLTGRRNRLFEVVRQLGSDSHILPYRFNAYEDVLDAHRQFKLVGLYAPIIRPPTVPPGTFCIRLSLRADLPNGVIESIQTVVTRFKAISNE